MRKSMLVDVGKVIKCEERVKDGKVFFVLVVDGFNSVYRVFHVEPFEENELVLVFEREGRFYIGRFQGDM